MLSSHCAKESNVLINYGVLYRVLLARPVAKQLTASEKNGCLQSLPDWKSFNEDLPHNPERMDTTAACSAPA